MKLNGRERTRSAKAKCPDILPGKLITRANLPQGRSECRTTDRESAAANLARQGNRRGLRYNRSGSFPSRTSQAQQAPVRQAQSKRNRRCRLWERRAPAECRPEQRPRNGCGGIAEPPSSTLAANCLLAPQRQALAL